MDDSETEIKKNYDVNDLSRAYLGEESYLYQLPIHGLTANSLKHLYSPMPTYEVAHQPGYVEYILFAAQKMYLDVN